ncbi:DUF6612 family protein [Phosphitispora fastidiosa]|uniref:DUF6612 family protein n=1 Tax=Phosphitispora fastidiosa TaxID=2837202 RepID=UPI001E62F1C1|nr:DUF6612 family protein [Phosphitispora fastidiosa]MBU7008755.1 hypothetical protein [Phosphitispora fastidiosa]
MKKALQIFMCIIFILTAFSGVAGAAEPVKVLIDDEGITFDVAPVIREGRTLVPVRKIVESMGGEVTWNEASRTVTVIKGDDNVVLVIDSNLARVNETDVVMDVPAAIIDGRTLIPLRFVSENLDAVVTWDAVTRTISIKTPVNIDEEAYALLAASMEKNKDIKKLKMDMEGEMEVSVSGMTGPESMKMGFVGNMKMDTEAPAFAFTGTMSTEPALLGQEMEVEYIFKDNVYYIKDPIAGTWMKMEMDPEEAEVYTQLIQQSSSLAIDYTAFLDAAKEIGAFREVSFAGEKVINGVQTTGVTFEINGLKLGKLVDMILTDVYGEAAAGDEVLNEVLNDETLNEMLNDAIKAITINKLSYTYWIGDRNNIYYGSDCEMKMGINLGAALGSMTMEGDITTTISDINKTQVITVPKEAEAAVDIMSGLDSLE